MLEHLIPDDAIIADIIGTLNRPEEYARKVLERMWDCRREHGAASVRIGVTGEGRAPNYRIEYPEGPTNPPRVYAVFYDSGHKQAENLGEFVDLFSSGPQKKLPGSFLRWTHWSSRIMNLNQVAMLLAEIRRRRC